VSTFDADFTAAALDDHFDQFGRDDVLFIPAEGPNRTITAILTDEGRELVEGRILDEEQQRVWVTVKRNESDATYGGIANPQQGDAIRHPDETEDSTPFLYQGERRNETPDSWELLFARNRLDAISPRGIAT
jgi:hypothetical protein